MKRLGVSSLTFTVLLGSLGCVASFSFAGCGGKVTATEESSTDAGSVATDASRTLPNDAGTRKPDADAHVAEASTPSNGPYPAFRPTVPQAVNSGGPVLASPKFVAITFAGDPLVESVETYISKIGGSSYWHEIGSEYGVGPATSLTPIRLNEAPPSFTTDSEIQSWLAAKIEGGAPFPQPDENTLYVVFYPDATTINLEGESSCETFGGYHFESSLSNGTKFPYAILPRCFGFAGSGDVLDTLTFSTSHELLEGATDPFPESDPAYQSVAPEQGAWTLLLGGELGDLCTWGGNETRPADIGFLVERQWSNKAASAYKHPCVPAGEGEIYFNTAPVLPDHVSNEFFSRGIRVPVGESRTIDLQLFSSGPTHGPWHVTVQEVPLFIAGGGAGSDTLDLQTDKFEGSNGDVIKLTITARRRASFMGSGFAIVSTYNGVRTIWPAVVVN